MQKEKKKDKIISVEAPWKQLISQQSFMIKNSQQTKKGKKLPQPGKGHMQKI